MLRGITESGMRRFASRSLAAALSWKRSRVTALYLKLWAFSLCTFSTPHRTSPWINYPVFITACSARHKPKPGIAALSATIFPLHMLPGTRRSVARNFNSPAALCAFTGILLSYFEQALSYSVQGGR